MLDAPATLWRPLLVLGGNKSSTIEKHPILKWTHERLTEYLSKPDTRLMVIGYSFDDEHINRTITTAADAGGLRLFIIDPAGVEVLDENRKATIWTPGPMLAKLQNHLIGASQRPMGDIFGGDLAEHAKVMRFFD